MDDRFMWTIQCYIEDQWIEPAANWPPYWFNRSSYSRWAAYEILGLLKDRGDIKASLVIRQFRDKMDDYSCYNQTSRLIFSIVREAADDILDVVRAME